MDKIRSALKMLLLLLLCLGLGTAVYAQSLPSTAKENDPPASGLPKVQPVDLHAIDPQLFDTEEWFVPYYLKHFAEVANSVLDTGKYAGFIDLAVWRSPKDNAPYNARIMENILSLVWFYTRHRPWNPYYGDTALKSRIEAALTFWCNMQHDDGRFSEYAFDRWSLAPTAFATKFVGMALYLLKDDPAGHARLGRHPAIDHAVFERARQALRKDLYISFTDAGLWEHGKTYTNQYANLWGGAMMYLRQWPDPEIDQLLRKRLQQSMAAFQSPCGFFYERGGPDWGYDLGTHHSDLQVAWHFAKDTDLAPYFTEKTRDWYEWFAYNAVKEPGTSCYFLNRAIETRQHKWIYEADTLEDPAAARWTPQAASIPIAQAFQLSQKEYDSLLQEKYETMRNHYPEVAPLKIGEFSAFSPYAFLHHDLVRWLPSEEQKQEAVKNLPYLKSDSFVQLRRDPRSQTRYTFVRRPAYYAIFNAGQIVHAQQRYGLGLLWNPALGTVLQSQSATDLAAWGTKADGHEQVYEAGDLQAEFRVDGKAWNMKENIHELKPQQFSIAYPLGKDGHKQLDFDKDTLKVSVEHAGAFKEVLPVMVAEDARLDWDDQKISLQSKKGNMTIYFETPVKISKPSQFMSIGHKTCQVFELTCIDTLLYTFVFD